MNKLWQFIYSSDTGNIKNLSPIWDHTFTPMDGSDPSDLQELASTVSICNAALDKTGNAAASMPRQLQDEAGEEVESAPFRIDLDNLLYDWSHSVYVNGWAAGFVEGTAGADGILNKITGVRYIDVNSLTVEYNDDGSLKGFWRQLKNKRTFYPAEMSRDGVTRSQILYIWGNNRQEIGPNPYPPMKACAQEAAVLQAVTLGQLNYHNTGMIGNWAVKASVVPTQPERERTKSILSRLFSGGIKTQGNIDVLSKDLEFEKLQTDPNNLALDTIVAQNRQACAEALRTPLTLIQTQESRDRATMRDTIRDWQNSTIAPLTQMLLNALNTQVMSIYGLEYVILPEQLVWNQEEEREKASAWAQYVQLGGDPDLVAQSLGLEFLPGTFSTPVVVTPEPVTVTPEPDEVEEEDNDDMKTAEFAKLRRYLNKHGIKARRFVSDVLASKEIDGVYQEYGQPETAVSHVDIKSLEALFTTQLERAQLLDMAQQAKATTTPTQLTINVDGATHTINLPEMKPEFKAADVVVNVPQSEAPSVTVTNQVPQVETPIVQVTNNVEMPKVARETGVVHHDQNGRFKGFTTVTEFENEDVDAS